MKKSYLVFLLIILSAFFPRPGHGDSEYVIFDDKMLLDGYAKKYAEESKEVLLAIIRDDKISPYKTAAAVRVLREHYSKEIFAAEKKIIEKILLRRLSRAESSFVEIEIMHTLCVLDRYKYFESLIPLMIQLLDHYNSAVNEIAYNSINDILTNGPKRPREARIVFNTLRKILFLSRKKYENIKEPSLKLKQKLDFVRWAIKILGTQELQKLPPEIIDFL